MPRKVIPVDPSNWRLHTPSRGAWALSHSDLPDNEWAAVMRAAPGEDIRESAEERSARDFTDLSVVDALASLTEECAMIVQMIYAQSMSLREVERYTGIPKSTVARRRDEGKRLLAEALNLELPTPPLP